MNFKFLFLRKMKFCTAHFIYAHVCVQVQDLPKEFCPLLGTSNYLQSKVLSVALEPVYEIASLTLSFNNCGSSSQSPN